MIDDNGCELCRRDDCPGANDADGVGCPWHELARELAADRCEYGCSRTVANATVRHDIVPAVEKILAAGTWSPPSPGDAPTPDAVIGRITDRMAEILTEVSKDLHDIYDPAGVLMFWSARLRYLDGRRPCDVYAAGDEYAMEQLARHVAALADGNLG